MARATVGGTTNDFVASVGNDGTLRVAAATLTVWTADGVTRLTDLLLNGTQVTQIPVPKTGQIPVFSLPDGVTPPVAISANGQAKILIGQAPTVSSGSGGGGTTAVVDPTDPQVLIVTPDGSGSVFVDPTDPNVLVFA